MEEKPNVLYTEVDIAQLKSKWLDLTSNENVVGEKYWTMFDQLYRENQRHYHNFFHLKRLYNFFDEHAMPIFKAEIPNESLKQCTDSFLYSLWFHDVIYDPQRKDNEQKSADIFQSFASEVGLTDSHTQEVNQIILATISHTLPPNLIQGTQSWTTASLFLDADLSVLACESESYFNEYAWAIWKEYEFLGREKYLEGRTAVLNRMLLKDNLYYHPQIRGQLEAKARANIAKEISILQQELLALRLAARTVFK